MSGQANGNGNGNGAGMFGRRYAKLMDRAKLNDGTAANGQPGGRKPPRRTFTEDVAAGKARDGCLKPSRRGDLIIRTGREIRPEPVEWLYQDRIVNRAMNLLTGDKGAGKTSLAAMITTVITTGGCWSDHPGRAVPRGRVLILSAEEDPASVIRPRLERFGADLDLFEVIDGVRLHDEKGDVSFSLAQDLDAIEAVIEERGDVKLVVIDTITSYLGGVNEHKASEVRRVLEPFKRVAERFRFAVLLINHMNKGAGTKGLYRSSDSIAIPSLCRMTWLVARDPDDKSRSLMVPNRCNFPPGPALAFYISQGEGEGDFYRPDFEWGETIEGMDADDLLAREAHLMSKAGARGAGERKRQAFDFVGKELAKGKTPLADLNAEGRKQGIGRAAISRALKAHKAIPSGPDKGKSYELPPKLELGDARDPR